MELMKTNEIDRGVVYVAFGYAFLIQAINSLMSLRKSNPDLRAQLITNQLGFVNASIESIVTPFDEVTFVDKPDKDNRLVKISVYKYSIFQSTLYLDCDTEVLNSINSGFNLLNDYDFLIRPNPTPCGYSYKFKLPVDQNDCTLFNGGVWFFSKKENVRDLFGTWKDLFVELGNSADQPSLASTIHKMRNKIKIYPLSMIYNFRPGVLSKKVERGLNDDIKVYHYTGLNYQLERKFFNIHKLLSSVNSENRLDKRTLESYHKSMGYYLVLYRVVIRLIKGIKDI
jgi:lipopolysaccharide biosynthesis glycosyltransferase